MTGKLYSSLFRIKLKLIGTISYLFVFIGSSTCAAQDNYIIEVHGTQPNVKHDIIPQLHSAYVFNGRKKVQDGVVPSDHLFCSALEISHWFTDWYESSLVFYFAAGDSNRTDFFGLHSHNLFILPKKYQLPGGIGLGLVADIGYQKIKYFADDATLELTPVIDKKIKSLYMSANLGFVKSLHGLNADQSFTFSPVFKINYLIYNHLALGFEYYGTVGSLNESFPFLQQQHQLFAAVDFYNYNSLTLNVGYGMGLNNNTDRSVFKMMLGWKFHDNSKI